MLRFRNTAVMFLSVIFILTGLSCCLPAASAPADYESGMEITLQGIGDRHAFSERDERTRISHLESGQHSDYVLRYPLMYWRQWANQKLPPLRIFLCLLILVSIVQLFLPSSLHSARVIYDQRRLRMFGIGAVTCTLGCVIAGFLYRLELFAPLAGLILALIQALDLFGLVVAAQSIGIGFFQLIKRDEWQAETKIGLLARVWSGALFLSLIVLIPHIGALPPIGNRLLCLIAVAGAGATLTSLRNGKGASEN